MPRKRRGDTQELNGDRLRFSLVVDSCVYDALRVISQGSSIPIQDIGRFALFHTFGDLRTREDIERAKAVLSQEFPLKGENH